MSGADTPGLSAALVARGIGLRPEIETDLSFVRDLYAVDREAEFAPAGLPATMLRAMLNDQCRLQDTHYRSAYPAAARWLVTRRRPDGDHEAAGRLYVDRTQSVWRLLEIGLVPCAQGQGLGGLLVRWLRKEAARSGATGIDLHVALDRPRARAFYTRLGFVPGTSDTFRQHMLALTACALVAADC